MGVMLVYSYICDRCGCYLDPGERCDCQDEKVKKMRKRQETIRKIEELEVSEWIQERLEICC